MCCNADSFLNLHTLSKCLMVLFVCHSLLCMTAPSAEYSQPAINIHIVSEIRTRCMCTRCFRFCVRRENEVKSFGLDETVS